ncbi:TetR/AcrR family transcriptional regulator [Streptomyces sp. NPDC002514]|uniref:TetR/AcrR family transcriptional regulator n=1 Tax=unclassified Streptomyces TaxID=2593676 RepID=UPI0036BC9E60
MSTPQRRPGGRTARVRRQILEATADILAEEGAEAVTVSAVAARAGVHHTTIYRSWKDRRSLIEGVIAGVVDLSVRLPDNGNLRDDLTELLESIIALLQSQMGPILVALTRSPDESLANLPQIHWKMRVEHCAAVLARARARGELAADVDPRLVLDLLTGPNHRRTQITREPLNDIDVARTVDIVVRGITQLTADG